MSFVREAGMNRRDLARIVCGGAFSPPLSSQTRPARIAARGAAEPVGYIKAAFTYPPTARLREEGYYSWPGSGFDAEGRQKQYSAEAARMAAELNLRLDVEPVPLDSKEDAGRFLKAVEASRPDGLLLIPLKKSHIENVLLIADQTGLPTIVFTSVGVLLNQQLREAAARPKLHLIHSFENLAALREAMKFIQARRRMAESTILNLSGEARRESRVPHFNTRIQQVPLTDFYELFARTGRSDEISERAQRYLREAVRLVEPTEQDAYEAAKCYAVLKEIIRHERADAVMMNCLPGLRHPRKHVPPCMGFMDLRDEGIPAGCQADLDATLTLMLVEYLFDRPAFQHNPSADTASKLYFGAHCTSPCRMQGPEGRREPYALRSHAEAGWGCVPQVLFSTGQKVTIANYQSRLQRPEMVIYSGVIVGCPASPPAGGCRTNVQIRLDQDVDPIQLKGEHLSMWYGDHAAQLRAFCRLHDITATV